MDIVERLKNYPFVVLIIPLLAGLLVGYYFYFDTIVLIAIVLIAIVLQVSFFRVKLFAISYLHGVLIASTMFVTGMWLMELQQSSHPISINTDEKTTSIIKILDIPEERTNTFRTRGLLLQQDSIALDTYPKTLVYCYFNKDSAGATIQPGDVIATMGFIQRVKNSGNPDEFDYQAYLQRRNILYQTFIKNESCTILGRLDVPWHTRIGSQAKTYAGVVFENYISDFPIVAAMILGERDELDRSMKQQFSEAGIMHILAISGLHVGLILLFLNASLFFLTGSKFLKVSKVFLIVFFLWAYAWITGFSPSVVRATMMFSFFTLGKLTSKKANSFNILAFTAFVMLVMNPYNIFEVGFQLSFIAVLSILFFYPRIYGLIRIKQIIPDKLWQIVSVSLAAQVLTFPLTIYYFHQFSTWFLLSNLIAIPVVFLIVLLSLSLLFVSKIPLVAEILGNIVDFLIQFLLAGTRMVTDMPGNLLVGLHLSSYQLIILYVVLSLLMMLFVARKKKYAFAILFFLIAFINLKTLDNWFNLQKKELVVFNVSGASVISILQNGQASCFLSDTSQGNAVSYAVDNYYVNRGVWENTNYHVLNEQAVPMMKLFNNSYYFHFENKDFVILNDDISKWSAGIKLKADYLVLSKNVSYLDLQDLSEMFITDKLIIDASVNYYITQNILEQNKELNYDIHVVKEEGAFRLYH